MVLTYKTILLHNRIICKLIYTYLPNELIDIIKEFLKPKEWYYFIFIIKKHIKTENLYLKPLLSDNFVNKVLNNDDNFIKTVQLINNDYDYKYISKTRKLNRKEYLLSKIKIKYNKQPNNIKNKHHNKQLCLINDFLKKNICLNCKNIETPEEPFVDYCNNCSSYPGEYYYLSSWDNRYEYYDSDDYDDYNECRYCIRPYRSCRCIEY